MRYVLPLLLLLLAAPVAGTAQKDARDADRSLASRRSPAAGVEGVAALVQDGSFEAGPVPDYWTQASTTFGTPICDAICQADLPRTGTGWVWFGGTPLAEAASVEQAGQISAGPKLLTFYVWWASSVATPPDPAATFNVKIDGTTVFSLTPATASGYNTAYTLASVDIAAYSDGNSHTLRFEASIAAAASSTNIHIDDIEIIDNPAAADIIFADGFDPAS